MPQERDAIRTMKWDLHGIAIAGKSNDARLRQRWREAFDSLPAAQSAPDIELTLDVVDLQPPAPQGPPHFRQGNLLHYYVEGYNVVAHFPKYGQMELDLSQSTSEGRLIAHAIEHPGVLEDFIAIALSPHLRRRGKFLLHAFAAAREGRAVLLVGSIGAGKTTSGLALLQAGWRLLSNDSPVVDESGQILSYPGMVAAFADTMRRFSTTRSLAPEPGSAGMGTTRTEAKILVAAHALWPGVWLSRAEPHAICFPQIDSGGEHRLLPLSGPETLRRLLPHAIEQWDQPMIPIHLAVLRRLVEAAPGYELRLGPDTSTLAPFLTTQLNLNE